MNALVPNAPPCLIGFDAGEDVGERAGARAERADVLAYMRRKRDNAQRVVDRGFDQNDFAAHTVRAISILIDDLTTGLHEGEGLLSPTGTATSEAYPFHNHRTMADVTAAEAAPADIARRASPQAALTQTGEN